MSNAYQGRAFPTMHCLACKKTNTRRAGSFVLTGNVLAGTSIDFSRCLECGAGQIEHASYDYFGAFDDDPDPTHDWDGYPLSPADAEALERFLLAHCPAPLDPKCGCALHAHLENQVRYLPFAPWPGSPGDPLARSGYVHPTRVVIAEGNVRLVRACADRHPGDALL